MTKQQQINTTIPTELVRRMKQVLYKHGLTMRAFSTAAWEAELARLERDGARKPAAAKAPPMFPAVIKQLKAPAVDSVVKRYPIVQRKGSFKSGWLVKRHDDCPGWLISSDKEVVACTRCQRFAKDSAARWHVKKLWQGQNLPFSTEEFWLGWGMHPKDVKTAQRLWKEDAQRITAYQAGKSSHGQAR